MRKTENKCLYWKVKNTIFYFVTNRTDLSSDEVVLFYEKRGNAEITSKKPNTIWLLRHLLLQSFWANEAIFQLMMLAYNLFLLFKMTLQTEQNTDSRLRLSLEIHIPGREDIEWQGVLY